MVRTRLLLILCALVVLCTGTPGMRGAGGRDASPQDRSIPGPVTIEWPSRRFDNLQAAIDAAPDGATIRILPGLYSITAPLVVRGKSLTIAGAGSGQHARGGTAAANERQRMTHLQGPVPTEVVEGRVAVGLINYDGGGGVLRGLRLSGFDASVLGLDSRDARPLMIRDCVLTRTSRGCLWYAPANLTITGSSFFDILKNAISFVTQDGVLTVFDVTMIDLLDNGVFLSSGDQKSHVIANTTIAFAGGGGIVVLNTGASIQNCGLLACEKGGIWCLHSLVAVGSCFLHTNAIAGMAALASVVDFQDNEIHNTIPNPAGKWGDGITLFPGPQFQTQATVFGNLVADSARAGLSNFGSVVALQDNTIQCASFELEGEPYLGFDFTFANNGGNACGCPDLGEALGACTTETVGIEAPEAIGAIE
jgi:hypothetical protein